MKGLLSCYVSWEVSAIEILRRYDFFATYMTDLASARITLFLLVVGTLAFINELWITIEMSFLQRETYGELYRGSIDEALRSHRMVQNDEYHGREWLDERTGIVIEEFETREKFFAKPVHVAHVYVNCNVRNSENGDILLSEPLAFHIEFSPEEYEKEKRPEFGSSLIVLRKKLYHFFKDCDLYQDLSKQNEKPFTVSQGVQIFNSLGEELPTNIDDIQLCFLKIQTGDTIECTFVL
ncbi:LAMI_0G16358g1_1 [Lachancea mirantina]|uniref:LAMI_0G16358g1_1 n=1 Tax=Lachancea mirantina TaxID=1230905 RepID=A0A1G4KCS6_9SACH|nr:LAMI_0G16358g1_1 [Lachancea mirantina]